jgi:hypothetical protein
MGKKPLKYENQWEADIYSFNGKPLLSLREVEINGRVYPVKSRNVAVPYSEMGVKRIATSLHYFVTENVFGIDLEFDLNTIITRTNVYPINAAW